MLVCGKVVAPVGVTSPEGQVPVPVLVLGAGMMHGVAMVAPLVDWAAVVATKATLTAGAALHKAPEAAWSICPWRSTELPLTRTSAKPLLAAAWLAIWTQAEEGTCVTVATTAVPAGRVPTAGLARVQVPPQGSRG